MAKFPKKKKGLPKEELKEFKGGKYMGGPAEEKAEKKKGKRMAMGGAAVMGRPDSRPMPGRRIGQQPGDNVSVGRPSGPPMMPKPRTPIMNDPGFSRPLPPGLSNKPGIMPPGLGGARPPRPAMPPALGGIRPRAPGATESMPGTMKGGGLARKGVGQALAKGGLVKGAGAASRGVKKPRYC